MRRRHIAFVLVVVTSLALVRPPAGADEEFHTATGLSESIYSQSITEKYRVPTEHGTIFGYVRRPVVPEGVKVPVILTYSPYNVQSQPHNDLGRTDGLSNYYVPRGYARAWFDLVGTRESSGCYDYGGIRERETGAAVVDFLGTRDWSNGKVGMIGASYDGTTAYATAIEAPEHLTTIVPQVAIDRWYDYPYEGGVRRYSGFGTPLLFDFAFGVVPSTDPSDPAHVAAVAADRAVPCDRIEHQIRGYQWDPLYDSFYDERDYRSHADKVRASVLIEGGWLDNNVQNVGSVRFFQALPDDHPKKIVMGQWAHATPDSTIQEWVGIRHAWFDYWLLGYDGKADADGLPDTGVMDIPRFTSQLPDRTITQFESWPPAGTATVDLALTTTEATGPRELGLDSGPDTTYDTTNPAQEAGSILSGSCNDACVVFLGAPLEDDVRLSGTPYLDLAAKSVAHDPTATSISTQYGAFAFVQLPSGQRARVADGWLNTRNRDGLRTSADAANGDPYEMTIELSDFDRVVPAGSRLGVAITSNVVLEVVPEDDPPTLNTILDGSVLRVPVSEGIEWFSQQ